MNSSIKVFKLVNGEELIGNLIDSEDVTIIKIENPMVFQTTTMLDDRGNPYDMTVLKDWMVRADVRIAELPKSQISLMFTPNKQTIKLYNLEIQRQSESEIILDSDQSKLSKNDFEKSLGDMFDMFLNNMNDMMYNESMNDIPKKRKKKKPTKIDDPSILSFMPDELKKRPMIYLSMIIPPEAIMNLITAGVLDPEQLLAMIEEVKKNNKFTGDEKKRKDFGNKSTDWNPDPESNDYT